MRLTQGNNVFKNLVKPNAIKHVELGCWGWDAVINHTHTHTQANFCQQDTYGLIFQTH